MDQRRVTKARAYVSARERQAPEGKRRFNWRLIRSILLALGVLLALRAFNLRQLEIIGATRLDPGEVRQVANISLQKGILPPNLLWTRIGRARTELLQRYSILEEVGVSRRWPRTLVIKLQERQPALVWKTTEQFYWVDTTGTVIGSIPEDDNQGLVVVADSNNIPVSDRQRIVPANFVDFCRQIAEEMALATGLEPTVLRVQDSTSELYVSTQRDFLVKFDTTRGAGEQLVALKTVLNELAKQRKTPTEYIDLRIPDRAYYL